MGNGSKGPYLLSWKGIRAGSDAVLRDGSPLVRGTDYTVDVSAGSITFTAALQAQQITRVSYQCDPAVATQNATTISIPFKWNIFEIGKSSLTFNSLFKEDPQTAASGSTPLLSSLNFVGNTRFLTNSALTSGLYVDLRGGDWLDRSAIKLADKTTFKEGDISLLFDRAGKHFLQGSASGLTPGKEISELLTTLHPTSSLIVKTTLRETTDLPDLLASPGSVPVTTREAGASLALSLPNNLKISASAANTSVTTPGTGIVSTAADSAKIDGDLPGHNHVSASFDSQQTSSAPAPAVSGAAPTPATSTLTQKSAVTVTSKTIDQVAITGSFKNEVGATGTTDTGALSVEATPFHKDKKLARLKITAALQDQTTSTGSTMGGSARVAIPNLPIAQSSLTGGVSYSSTPLGSQTVGLLDASAKPLKFIEVSGGARLRDGYLADNSPDPSVVNTYNMKLAVGPSAKFKFTGSYASNPEASDGTVRRTMAQTVGLESDLRLIKFTGQFGYEQDYLTTHLSNSMLLGLDLRLTSRDTLSTGWEGHSTLDTSLAESTIYRLGYTHKLGSAIDVSFTGSMTQTAVNGVFTPNSSELKAEAKIGLHF